MNKLQRILGIGIAAFIGVVAMNMIVSLLTGQSLMWVIKTSIMGFVLYLIMRGLYFGVNKIISSIRNK